MLLTAVAPAEVVPYMAISRCLSTMKIDFVPLGSDAGSVPWFAVVTTRLRAGHVAGIGGGGVTWMRRTYCVLLDEPLYPLTPIVATPLSPDVMICAASLASPRLAEMLPTGIEPTGIEPT